MRAPIGDHSGAKCRSVLPQTTWLRARSCGCLTPQYASRTRCLCLCCAACLTRTALGPHSRVARHVGSIHFVLFLIVCVLIAIQAILRSWFCHRGSFLGEDDISKSEIGLLSRRGRVIWPVNAKVVKASILDGGKEW